METTDTNQDSTKVAEWGKKLLTVGLGAVFFTEDVVRQLGKEITLPKELVGKILESASRTRKDFYQRFSADLIEQVMERVDLKGLAKELFEENEIEVRITLVPKASKQPSSDPCSEQSDLPSA